VPDAALLSRAAECYRRAGLPVDAARCYRAAGMYRHAAQAWERLEAFTEAARDYAAAGAHEEAAWILVHQLGDARAARIQIAAAQEAAGQAQAATGQAADGQAAGGQAQAAAELSDVTRRATQLRRRLILARCDAAEGADRAGALATLDEVTRHLEHDTQPLGPVSIEQLAVAVAEALGRPDLVALLFAAAVRAGRYQAARRWDEWSRRVLGVPLVLPEGGAGQPMALGSAAGRHSADGAPVPG
jgi:hypothetical protein